MRNKLKKIRNLLAITLLIALSSCEKDIYEDALNPSTLKKRTITFTEFKNNAKAYKSYKKVQKVERTNFSKNLVLDSLTNFMLDMDKVVEITNGNTTSYTILIEDLNDPTKVKNLVFTEKVNGEFDVFLTKYTLTEEERKRISEGEVLDLLSKTELFAQSRGGDLSNPVRIDANGNCYAIDRVWEENGFVKWTIVYVTCPDGMGGVGSSNSSGNSSTNSGGFWTPIPFPGSSHGGDVPTPIGGANAATGDTDFSAPVLPAVNKDNCLDLKAKSNSQDFKDKMNELKVDAGGGFETVYQTFVGNPKFSPKFSGTLADPSSAQIPIPTRLDCTGFMHCHLNDPAQKDFAIFTPYDFIVLSKLIANSNALMTNFTMYVTSNIQGVSNIYAIKITDIAKFNLMAGLMEAFPDMYNKIWSKDIDEKNTPDVQVNNFLKQMQKAGLEGFELYKSDENLQNWEQQTLNNSGNTIKIKC